MIPVVKSHWIALPLFTSVSVKTRRLKPGFAGLVSGESSVKTAYSAAEDIARAPVSWPR
jgi:hypothetical protein